MNRNRIVDLQLHKEKVSENAYIYYLSATYRYENDRGVYEATIPRILLPVSDCIIIKRTSPEYHRLVEDKTVDIGFGDLTMVPDAAGNTYYERLVREKIHDMTLDEIEKKLGFKVRVVSEK